MEDVFLYTLCYIDKQIAPCSPHDDSCWPQCSWFPKGVGDLSVSLRSGGAASSVPSSVVARRAASHLPLQGRQSPITLRGDHSISWPTWHVPTRTTSPKQPTVRAMSSPVQASAPVASMAARGTARSSSALSAGARSSTPVPMAPSLPVGTRIIPSIYSHFQHPGLCAGRRQACPRMPRAPQIIPSSPW